ncbi:Sporulation domain protein [Ferrimonas balearica DSM 9799]|uniref:Sporulation domain protein n=1 Tax=Ferrimonas balearica (strain DSM 9799 / CCM 4581 / KCTC 23876 / PAT) TaxID=550540 RepID=E1SMI2_FERBD|nr:AAA family ATPase [Ferrimonas balearica]ADN74537.1 Sporulation domain protein [Ferrimonas balearica DSM 9799]
MIADPALNHLLPSQRALLERFRYLTEYGDHLLVLHGAAGVGKTVLAQSLLDGAESFNQAYVAIGDDLTPASVRERLIRQWLPRAVFDPEEPLLDTLERILPEGDGRYMLIVDDAQSMGDALLAELIALVMDQETLGMRLTLVLVADDGLVQRLQQNLPEPYQTRLIPVEVPPLSVRERRKLYDQLVKRHSGKLFINQAAVERQLAEQDGSAAAVVALVEAAKSRPPLGQSLPAHKGLAAAIGAAVLLLAGGLLWPTTEPAPQPEPLAQADRAAAPEPEPEQQAPQPLDLGLAKPWPEVTTAEVAIPEVEPALLLPEDEIAVATAPVVSAETESVAQAQPAETATAAVAQPAAQPMAQPAPDSEAKPEPSVEPAVAAVPAVLPLSEQPLAQRPADSYVLQLAVFSYPQLIGPFLDSHGLGEAVRVYRIEREPQAWFVVVQGGFADRKAAQQAKEALVASVKRLSPYVKPLEAVQKELSEELELAEILR